MRIAIDVKGTLEGPRKQDLIKLIKAMQAKGHTVLVWSNLYSYAVDAVRDNALNCTPQSKTTKWDVSDESQFVDLAIDDDSSQTWLAAKRFIWVHQLPDDIQTLIEELSK